MLKKKKKKGREKKKRYFDGMLRLTLNQGNKQPNEIIKTLVEWSSQLLWPHKKPIAYVSIT